MFAIKEKITDLKSTFLLTFLENVYLVTINQGIVEIVVLERFQIYFWSFSRLDLM